MSGDVVSSELTVDQIQERERTPSGGQTFSSDALHGSDSSATMPSKGERFGRSVTYQLKLLNDGMNRLNNGMNKVNDRMEKLDKKMKFAILLFATFYAMYTTFQTSISCALGLGIITALIILKINKICEPYIDVIIDYFL